MAVAQCILNACISIHALRGEGDTKRFCPAALAELFQSTPSVGRATTGGVDAAATYAISIHALRGEGDILLSAVHAHRSDFNPRPPWGGRRHTEV